MSHTYRTGGSEKARRQSEEKGFEMASKEKVKIKAKDWTDSVDPEAIKQAYDEACTDCYGDEERHTGLVTAILDIVQTPFRAKALGKTVEIVGIEWPEKDPYGLDLICEVNGKHHRIECHCADILEPLPEGHEYLAAYLDWKKRLA